MAVEMNFTHWLDDVIEKRNVILSIWISCVSINSAQFVKNFWIVRRVNIYIRYICENTFDSLLNEFNQKLLKEKNGIIYYETLYFCITLFNFLFIFQNYTLVVT